MRPFGERNFIFVKRNFIFIKYFIINRIIDEQNILLLLEMSIYVSLLVESKK